MTFLKNTEKKTKMCKKISFFLPFLMLIYPNLREITLFFMNSHKFTLKMVKKRKFFCTFSFFFSEFFKKVIFYIKKLFSFYYLMERKIV